MRTSSLQFLWRLAFAISHVLPVSSDLSLDSSPPEVLLTCAESSCTKNISKQVELQGTDSFLSPLDFVETASSILPNANRRVDVFPSSSKKHSDYPLNFISGFQNSSVDTSPGNEVPKIVHRSWPLRTPKTLPNKKTTLSHQNDSSSEKLDLSLERLLKAVIARDLQECDLIMVVGRSFQASTNLQNLLRSPNLKQVIYMDDPDDLSYGVVWSSPRCQGTLVLMSDPEPFIAFGNEDRSKFLWDYRARVVIAGLSEFALGKFLDSKKGKKTEHIVGVVKGSKDGHYKILMNQLFWGKGFKRISIWQGYNFTSREEFFPDKVSNLRKGKVRVLIFEWQPAIIYHYGAQGEILLRYGRDTAVVRALAEALNFTLVFKDVPVSEQFGIKLANGSFNGMVGGLGSHNGDIAVANLYMSAIDGRDEFQEYSTAYGEDKSCCMARVDPPPPSWHSPGLPFQTTTWIVIGTGLVLTGPVLYFLVALSRKSGIEKPIFKSLAVSSLYTYGVHFSHPMADLPRSSSIKLFVAFLWIYSIILTTGYRSNLTAFLTIALKPASIETFEELYHSGLKVEGIPFFRTSLEGSELPHLRALAENYVVKMTLDETTQDILAGKAVNINSNIYLEAHAAKITTPRGEPLVRIMKECLTTHAVGLAYPRNSPLKSKSDMAILRIFESGLVRRWLLESINLHQKLNKQDMDNKEYQTNDEEKKSDGATPLSLSHLQGVFIVLGFGYGISSALFALEVGSGYGKFPSASS